MESVRLDVNWWEQPYNGQPMVKVNGFPRPLYPPDANRYGKQPSMPGPDVVAYKRGVWRAGRWEGPASRFDDQFSNGFSHGSGGNVIDTGVAGVQRQQNITNDTGWIGQATFNLLRSIIIPAGLPNAGQPALDATAVQLINEAYDLFGGHEPPPADARTVRVAALDRARSQIGTGESPPGSNSNKYTDWYGMVGPWCAMFAAWCFELGASDVGKDSPSFVRGSRYAYVPYLLGDAYANRYGLTVISDPQPGDIVTYDWSLDGVPDHVGIFERWESGTQNFVALEGNTSEADNSNGGQVMRRTRPRGSGVVFIRAGEPS